MNNMNRHLDFIGLKMHKPRKELEPYVQCYWSTYREKNLKAPVTRKIISDGGMGIVFNYGGALTIKIGSEVIGDLCGCFITGPTINATYLTLQESVDAIGIRFCPSGAYPFIQGDMDRYRNTVLPLSVIDEPVWVTLMQKLQKESLMENKLGLLDNFLIEALSRNKIGLTDWLLKVIKTMWLHNGSMRIDELCTNMNMSKRQFERKFKKAVGLLPKQISRIIRVDKSRALIRSLDFRSLTDIGCECEYFDQAHFIKEFREIVEATPRGYFQEKKKMSVFYNS
ncbi:MAG: helix-turn-helix transcriptional regulator [Candidatus Omnitrophica bacterium]|nr:helix-turn-helix transcriptional regulator [Candidatus Omnitrophota bacterium]